MAAAIDSKTGSKEYLLEQAYHGLLASFAYNDSAREGLAAGGVSEFVRIAKRGFSGHGFSEDDLRVMYRKLMAADHQRQLYESISYGGRNPS